MFSQKGFAVDNWTVITSVWSYEPAHSPDGNRIVYKNNNDWGKLYKKSANDTSNWTAITSAISYDPAYSPDWNWIVYVNVSKSYKLYKKSADDTSNWTAITSAWSYSLAYSPDWNWIVYRNRSDADKLYKKSADDTSNWTAITSVASHEPAHSPDWNWIVYRNENDWNKLYKKSADDTSNWTAITSVVSEHPAYSPDWNWIVYKNGDDWNKLYKKFADDTSNWTAITSVVSEHPAYSPDWNWIVYKNGDDWSKLYKKTLNIAPTISLVTSVVSYINSLNETSVPFIINWITDPDTWNILTYKYSWDWASWTDLAHTETSPKSSTTYNFNVDASGQIDWSLILRVKVSDWIGESNEVLINIDKETVLPVITIVNPWTVEAQSKILTVSANEWTLTMSLDSSWVCNWTLWFIAYSDTTFSSESDNWKTTCYKSEDTAWNISYELSNAIAWIDTTAPVWINLELWEQTFWDWFSVDATCTYSTWLKFIVKDNWVITDTVILDADCNIDYEKRWLANGLHNIEYYLEDSAWNKDNSNTFSFEVHSAWVIITPWVWNTVTPIFSITWYWTPSSVVKVYNEWNTQVIASWDTDSNWYFALQVSQSQAVWGIDIDVEVDNVKRNSPVWITIA